jgi:hypothetical protein
MVKDVGPEVGLARKLRVAEVREPEEVLDAAEHRVVVVRGLINRARGDAGREQHRAHVTAAGAVGARLGMVMSRLWR